MPKSTSSSFDSGTTRLLLLVVQGIGKKEILLNLRGLVKVLILPKTQTYFCLEIDSIPSMWARPLLFEMALYNDRHPVHTRILGEWRGLLAMLALKEWCDFPLTTEQP